MKKIQFSLLFVLLLAAMSPCTTLPMQRFCRLLRTAVRMPQARGVAKKTVLGLVVLTGSTAGLTAVYADGASTDEQEFNKFTKKHAPPKQILELLKRKKNEVSQVRFGKVEGDDNCSSVMVKGSDVARVINAARLRNCIKRKALTTVAVPQKYFHNIDGEWMVVAEYVNAGEGRKLTHKEVQQLATLAEETGYRDWRSNVLVDSRNGKLTIIDTEDLAFALGFFRLGGEIPAHCKVQYIASLVVFRDAMDQESLQWLQDRLNELLKTEEGTKEDSYLGSLTKYDDPEIDFEAVKRHFAELLQRKTPWWEEEDPWA